jgi:hypothetical protein
MLYGLVVHLSKLLIDTATELLLLLGLGSQFHLVLPSSLHNFLQINMLHFINIIIRKWQVIDENREEEEAVASLKY